MQMLELELEPSEREVQHYWFIAVARVVVVSCVSPLKSGSRMFQDVIVTQSACLDIFNVPSMVSRDYDSLVK